MFGFKWIVKGKLAAASQPGLYKDMEDDFAYLKARGVDYVVSLIETSILEGPASKFGLGFYHFPIKDMDIPVPDEASRAITQVSSLIDQGHVPVIHCKGGVGRSGMVAACYMVAKGMISKEAIRYVRAIQPQYIQTKHQERFVHNFARFHLSSDLESD